MGSIVPFLISFGLVVSGYGCYRLYRIGRVKTAFFLMLVGLALMAGVLRFEPKTNMYRQGMERKTFDRYREVPEKVVVEKEAYEDRMSERHESLREESDQLIEKYLGEESEKSN